MTDVVNPKSASPDQLLPYHKKISAEGKALMICFISYTYMVLKGLDLSCQAPGGWVASFPCSYEKTALRCERAVFQ